MKMPKRLFLILALGALVATFFASCGSDESSTETKASLALPSLIAADL